MPLNLILMGPPGAGKGTQASRLAQRLQVPAISTGDMLREEIRGSSALGCEAKAYMDRGALVPDRTDFVTTQLSASGATGVGFNVGMQLKINDREMEMAFALIDLLRKPFEPEEYKDHYREALSQVIDAKLEGREVVESPAPKEAGVIDLADALRKSVEAAKKSKPKRAAQPKARPAARRAARKVS